MEILCPFHPLEEIDQYLRLTDWFVMKSIGVEESLSRREKTIGGKVGGKCFQEVEME